METMELAVGASQPVALPGLASAGYQWFAATDNPMVAKVEKLENDQAAAAGARSGSHDELFSITALSKGNTVLHFFQKRAFQPDQAANATRDMKIIVK